MINRTEPYFTLANGQKVPDGEIDASTSPSKKPYILLTESQATEWLEFFESVVAEFAASTSSNPNPGNPNG